MAPCEFFLFFSFSFLLGNGEQCASHSLHRDPGYYGSPEEKTEDKEAMTKVLLLIFSESHLTLLPILQKLP